MSEQKFNSLTGYNFESGHETEGNRIDSEGNRFEYTKSEKINNKLNPLSFIKDLPKESINFKDEHGRTLLMKAVQLKNFETVKSLLEKKAEPNITTDLYETAIFSACRHDLVDVVRLLVQFRSEINIQNKFGYSPLMEAVYFGNTKTIKLLLELNADPELKDKSGYTAFDKAQDRQALQILKKMKK